MCKPLLLKSCSAKRKINMSLAPDVDKKARPVMSHNLVEYVLNQLKLLFQKILARWGSLQIPYILGSLYRKAILNYYLKLLLKTLCHPVSGQFKENQNRLLSAAWEPLDLKNQSRLI
jgi:hypothetical protein